LMAPPLATATDTDLHLIDAGSRALAQDLVKRERSEAAGGDAGVE
jgi:hypothetical protein